MILTTDDLKGYQGRVAMVDGAFDPLHHGHIEYFRCARAFGMPLLCNIASDSYVSAKHPPLLEASQRAAVIDALSDIDYTHVSKSDTETVLRELHLWDRRGETARNLSGGMKRRLMIARALVHKPKLLILDEPTAGVDIEIRRSMWKFLRTINRNGTTIILTTHYLEEAENLCRHVAIIDDGVIVEDDRMSAVLHKLNQGVFVLNLRHPVEIAPTLNGFDVEKISDHELEVEIHIDQNLNGLFSALSTAGVEVISMRNKTSRLEELFVRLIQRRDNERDQEQVVEEFNL